MIDLHLHMDGAITPEIAKKLADMQGIDIPATNKELEELIRVPADCRDLNQFLEKFEFPSRLTQTKEGISEAFRLIIDDFAKSKGIYAEIRFAPQLHTSNGLSQREVVEAALDGVKKSSMPDRINLILCCMRGSDTMDKNLKTIDVAKEYLGKGVCAVDLAGAEGLFSTQSHQYMFDACNKADIPFIVHAGEADGWQSVKAAVDAGAKRIGHGIRALENDDLVKELAAKKIPLELCPTSNLCTAMFTTMDQYPIRKMMKQGLKVTINTDDPAIEGTNIHKEYQHMINSFWFTPKTIKELLTNAAEASFADDETKKEIIASVNGRDLFAIYDFARSFMPIQEQLEMASKNTEQTVSGKINHEEEITF